MDKELRKLNNEILKIVKRIIKTKRGGKNNRPAKKITGRLREPKVFVTFNENSMEFEFDLETVEYYQYLDEGTKRIKKPWFYTKEITESKEVLSLFQDFVQSYFNNKIEKIWQ